MTSRAVGTVVEALNRNPKLRIGIVVADQQARKLLWYELLDLIRNHKTLKLARMQDFELAVEGGHPVESNVMLFVPHASVVARRLDHVIFDEVPNDPKNVWVQSVLLSRLARGGSVTS